MNKDKIEYPFRTSIMGQRSGLIALVGISNDYLEFVCNDLSGLGFKLALTMPMKLYNYLENHIEHHFWEKFEFGFYIN